MIPDSVGTDDSGLERYGSLDELRDVHAGLLDRHATEDIAAAVLDAADEFIHRTQATGGLLDRAADRRSAQGLIDYWLTVVARAGRHQSRAVLAPFDERLCPLLDDDLCPYVGLTAFGESDAPRFFGRTKLVETMSGHLREHRLLAVVGRSGSGKSSLVLAGILPKLKREILSERDGWRYLPPILPGPDPLASLASAAAEAAGVPVTAGELREDPGCFTRLLGAKGPGACVMVVDQFEELFTLCKDEAGRQAFIESLVGVVAAPESSHRLILTMRSDYRRELDQVPAFKRLFEEAQCPMTPFDVAELREAIEKPAEVVGLRFEEGVVEALLNDFVPELGALPLLQFTLRRLWEKRRRNRITRDAYRELGGGLAALETTAEAVWRSLNTRDAEETAKWILLRLVRPSPGFEFTSSRAERRSLHEHENPERVDAVLRAFAEAGLLRVTHAEKPENDRVEVAHEALVRNWSRLLKWLDEYRPFFDRQQRHDAQVLEWIRLRPIGLDAGLLDVAQLREAEEWLRSKEAKYLGYHEQLPELISTTQTHIASLERREKGQQTRIRRLRWALVGVTVVALIIATGVFIWRWREADRESFARKLAMAAYGESGRDPQRGLLLATEAARLGRTRSGELLPEVERALRYTIRGSRVRALIKGYRGTFKSAEYAPDGSVLATGDSLGGVVLWDVATGHQRKALFGHSDDVNAIAFSPDGQKIASGSKDGNVTVWDVEGGRPLHVLAGHFDGVRDLAFSRPDGRLLATAGGDGSVRIWDVSAGKQLRALYGHIGGVKAVAFGRDEGQLVTAGDDDQVVVWDVLRGRVLFSFQFQQVFDVDLSPDGSMLAVAGTDAEIWDTATRYRLETLTGHTNAVLRVAFSRDQKYVATASYDGTVRVWQLPRNDGDIRRQFKEVARLPITTMYVSGLAFSPAGDRVMATTLEGNATIWSLTEGDEILRLEGLESTVEAVGFSPDGRTVAGAGGTDGQVLTWDMSGKRGDVLFKDVKPAKAVAFSRSGHLAVGADTDVLVRLAGGDSPMRLSGHRDVVNDLAFNPDGSRLVSVSHDRTAIVWELPSGKKLRMLEGHKDHVVAVAYSPDGRTVATGSGSRDSTIRLWRADTWELVRTIEGHILGILDLAFTADGRQLVSASKDKTVRIWDVSTGKEMDILLRNADVVNAVAISGDRLAMAADDGVRLWDLRAGTAVEVFPSRSYRAHSLAFSPDGRYLAAGGLDGVVRVYVMQADELLALAEKRVRRGWTRDECEQFLKGKPCPRSRYNALDEADQRFAKFDFKGGQRLLEAVKGGGSGDADLFDAEIAARLGSSFLWAASDVLKNPERWAKVRPGTEPEELAFKFLAAAKKASPDLAFDPQSRFDKLIAYRDVQRARELARAGRLKQSAAVLEKARAAGWTMPDGPERVASRLFALGVLSEASGTLRSGRTTREQLATKTKLVEHVLKLYPELGPGHRLLAALYEKQQNLEGATKHYLEAASKESGAEPFVRLAVLTYEHDPERAVNYAKQALARDGGLDLAWYIRGVAELNLKHEREAASAFDQVSPSSELYSDAINSAAAIYFDYLQDDLAAYQRLTRAMQLAPNNLSVLSNYAEFLLASNRIAQARIAAARARQHAEAQSQDMAYLRAAMSFVLFAAEFLSGEHARALIELDEIKRHVEAAKSQEKEAEKKWRFRGIRRSLDRMVGTPSREQWKALSKVLDFVESNGRGGTLNDMRRLLVSQAGEHARLREW